MSRANATCTNCKGIFETRIMVPVKDNRRINGKVAYLCQYCATNNEHYMSGRDSATIGGVEDGFKFGIELETNASSLEFRQLMFRFGFEATNDCSLDNIGERRYNGLASCEYVSATNKGVKRFAKQFIEIEKALNTGDVIMNDTCGTHCHISYNDMRNGEMGMICSYFQSIFTAIQNVMIANPEKTREFFGRYFTDYAPTFNADTHMRVGFHGDRYVWVNCTNRNNIEFRLNKFRTADQMRKCIMFEKWVVKTIVDNFTSKYHETADKKTLAKKTGAKLARKLQKIYDEM